MPVPVYASLVSLLAGAPASFVRGLWRRCHLFYSGGPFQTLNYYLTSLSQNVCCDVPWSKHEMMSVDFDRLSVLSVQRQLAT